MKKEDAIKRLTDMHKFGGLLGLELEDRQALSMGIDALEQESTIKALGEELRKARKGIADEKVLIGYNLAIAICNKHLGEVR